MTKEIIVPYVLKPNKNKKRDYIFPFLSSRFSHWKNEFKRKHLSGDSVDLPKPMVISCT